MEICEFRFKIQSTGAALGAVVRFDGEEIFNGWVSQAVEIVHEFDDEIESQHKLHIELHSKSPQHTRIDSDGTILSDVLLQISDFCLDGIALKHLFYDRCVYIHDTNGTADLSQYRFWGDMGCNGVVTFEFSSPVYMWLLENM